MPTSKDTLCSYDLKGISLQDRADRYLLALVPPKGHREVHSRIFAVFGNDDEAVKAAEVIGRAPVDLDAVSWVLAQAKAVVADPDLALGDFGVDVVGDVAQLPPAVQNRLSKLQGHEMSWRGICPLDLSEKSLEGMERSDLPLLRFRQDEIHQHLFRIDYGYVHVGIFHRNNMNRSNALLGLMRAGRFGPDFVDNPERKTGGFILTGVPPSYPMEGIERAPQREHGTAPVDWRLRERYQSLLDGLRAEAADWPLPELAKDAAEVISKMSTEYRRRKKAGDLPPTIKQIEYANDISSKLKAGVEFSQDSKLETVVAFIEANVEQYRQLNRDERHEQTRLERLESKARREEHAAGVAARKAERARKKLEKEEQPAARKAARPATASSS